MNWHEQLICYQIISEDTEHFIVTFIGFFFKLVSVFHQSLVVRKESSSEILLNIYCCVSHKKESNVNDMRVNT